MAPVHTTLRASINPTPAATGLGLDLSELNEEERLALMQDHLDRLNDRIAALKHLLP